jgi:DNA-binding response OmpR family regulator
MRIALVEDHARMADLIRTALSRAGIASDTYGTSAAARYWLQRQSYAALVLDRGLPDGDGLTMLASLRREGWSVPCLVLTARDALHDRVEGLEHGADDYLPKPFAIEELVARVRALLRRPVAIASRVFAIANLEVDAGVGRVRVDGVPVAMGANEFRLVLALADAKGALCSHTVLMDAVFGPFVPATRNTLEVALHRLRGRLRTHGANVELVNERGVGYALVAR